MSAKTPEAYTFNHRLITLIVGPMFAGKSQELLGRLERHEIVGQRILLINNARDTRKESGEANGAGVISTHRKNSLCLSHATEISVLTIGEVPIELVEECQAIGIDEAQFFPDIEKVIEWVTDLHKNVYVAGLISTSEGKIFGSVYKLIPFSKMIQLTAVCEMCHKQHGVIVEATMTKCLVQKDSDELVGSSEYIPVCFDHWLNPYIQEKKSLVVLKHPWAMSC